MDSGPNEFSVDRKNPHQIDINPAKRSSPTLELRDCHGLDRAFMDRREFFEFKLGAVAERHAPEEIVKPVWIMQERFGEACRVPREQRDDQQDRTEDGSPWLHRLLPAAVRWDF